MNSKNIRIYEFDDFRLDALGRKLSRGGEFVPLHGKAFDLLLVMVINSGRLLTKDELFAAVWPDQIVEESNLTVNMSAVRKALGERAGRPRYITTVSGRGYRFAAEVSELTDENSLPAGVVKEKKIAERAAETGGAHERAGVFFGTIWRKRSAALVVIVAAVALLLLGLGRYARSGGGGPNDALFRGFQKTSIKRLTNNGKVAGAALSPNGKYIAYVLGDKAGNSLWVQQVGTGSDVRVKAPAAAEIWGLTFSPDGAFIYYSQFTADKADVELYRVPSLGGVSQKIPGVVASHISFAPDGKRFAYVAPDAESDKLMIADVDGGNRRLIIEKKYPHTFEHRWRVVAWSPSGETIACLVNHFEPEASYSTVVGVNVSDGTEKPLSPRRWFDVLNVAWLKDDNHLLLTASDRPAARSQVWQLSLSGAEARQITNDPHEYDWLGVTAAGESFVAVQINRINSLAVGSLEAAAFREVISEVGPLNPLAWTPQGEIIYRSLKDGNSNFWAMRPDGGDRRQITADAQADERGLCLSPDGRAIVFASYRSGKLNLWRIDADGGNLKRLTNGEADAHPRCSPDGRWVVYQKDLYSNPTLWRVPLAGGEPERLTDFKAKWPAISGDGGRIAYFHMADGKWRIGVIAADARRPVLQSLDAPATLFSDVVHWAPDDRSLLYISTAGETSDIWRLPLDGSAPAPVTDLKTYRIDSFALSRDGGRLAVTRSTQLSDVVLIESLR